MSAVSSPYPVPATPSELTDLAAFLIGNWQVKRTLLERSTGQNSDFDGILQFSPSADGGLRYHEEGTLLWGATEQVPADQHDQQPMLATLPRGTAAAGYRVPAKRDYLLRATDDPAVLDWYFDYGVFFHRLDLRSGHWTAEHPCSADLYRVDYTVLDPDQLEVVWDVAGPRKNQHIASSWTRIS
ncbi:DUF6314 family protein [Psychromicrobium lacuslunae]|uniref:DUF6314 domain-containing protein n=1 Tax=Psychromicrobium lacuslunae TaxID=1618207 RepID=A0A0D4C2P8_9MICC|nr:DUF6314 family protein [Psychromicrobium lacuslunae]AJT42660.1 hypothetical protein UM93_16415 [Psychromicrobium lacuslunae]